MCTLGFRGKGYSLGFVKNYKKIAKRLEDNEDTLIEVVAAIDDICISCPHKISESLCQKQDQILKLDKAHSKVLKLTTGTIISWKQAKARIKKYMDVEKFSLSCNGCSWKKYGVCEHALEELISDH